MKKHTHLLKVSCYVVAFLCISCDESSSTNLTVNDDIHHCGTHDMDCATAIPGWADGTCENGTCKVTTCQNGLHVYENSCASDDIDNCGAHGASCRLTVNGWITGNCLQATCTVSECAEGMHVYANACARLEEIGADV